MTLALLSYVNTLINASNAVLSNRFDRRPAPVQVDGVGR